VVGGGGGTTTETPRNVREVEDANGSGVKSAGLLALIICDAVGLLAGGKDEQQRGGDVGVSSCDATLFERIVIVVVVTSAAVVAAN
jgi:hypothetical protein